MRFIDEHRCRFGGVEPICRVLTGHGLRIAASTYYKTKALPPSARSVGDARLLHHLPAALVAARTRPIWEPKPRVTVSAMAGKPLTQIIKRTLALGLVIDLVPKAAVQEEGLVGRAARLV